MEDPRTVFYTPEDHQVIVYMEWEGPTGKHHIEGSWKNPEGKSVLLSDFSYDAKERRFGAYWTLLIAEGTATGTWTLESHVDGEAAGSHTFQILSGKHALGDVAKRPILKPSEVYERASKAMVLVQKLDSRGAQVSQASGSIIRPGWILTAFEAIDGATKVRISLPNGQRLETDEVVAWNRQEDWALVKAATANLPFLDRAPVDSSSVGDDASFLNATAGGNREITNVSIDGKSNSPRTGPRLNISAPPGGDSIGAPLLNEYGEVIGIVGGSLIPGASSASYQGLGASVTPSGGVFTVQGGLAVPISALPSPASDAPPTSFATLIEKGEFIPLLTAARNVSYGELAHSTEQKGGMRFPVGVGDSFSQRDRRLTVGVYWEGREKRKGAVTLRIYDIDNRLLLNSSTVKKPVKLNLGMGEHSTTYWDFEISTLPVGVYRADVCLDDAPAWRSFFRVTN